MCNLRYYRYKYPPINPLWHSLLGLVMILLGIVSMIGNGVVLYLMTTVRSLRTPTNMLICNLALSDFLMMATNAPTMARELLHRPVYEKKERGFFPIPDVVVICRSCCCFSSFLLLSFLLSA